MSTNQLSREPISFTPPDASKLRDAGAVYAVRNYCGNGLVARFKRRRFKMALQMARDSVSSRVIDMGCCDGVLVPTLASHFDQVAAIDYQPAFVDRCERLAKSLHLQNVVSVCNQGVNDDVIRDIIGSGYQLMFALETLEHVGQQPDMWKSKLEFLNGCFQLLEPGPESRIIISVPKMVGWGFMLKHCVQWLRGVKDDQMPMREFWRSGILKNTDNLEELWNGGHVGFNHLKLEALIRQEFRIHNSAEDPFSAIYEIGRAETN